MLRTKTIGNQKQLKELLNGSEVIGGLKIVKVTNDGYYDNLRSITFITPDGQEFEIAGGDSSNRIVIIAPAPKEYAEKYVVKGTIDDIEIKDKIFDDNSEAVNFINNQSGKVNLVIEKIKVEI